MKQVVAALIIRENKILICQRTRHQTMPLKWEFPGGKIEAGERPEEALRRELEEELGICAAIGHKVAAIQHNYDSDSAVELHFFLVKDFAGELQNRIFNDVRWSPLERLTEFDFLAADLGLIRDLSEGKLL